MTICTVKTALEWISAGAAFLAAAFWFYASWIGRASFLDTPMDALDRIMTSQARYNAIAAFCAGIAAILQLATHAMPVCRAFG